MTSLTVLLMSIAALLLTEINLKQIHGMYSFIKQEQVRGLQHINTCVLTQECALTVVCLALTASCHGILTCCGL